MSKCFVHLGRNGDIINTLPILKLEAERTGKPANLLVSLPYVDLLDGCSYVTPIPFNGDIRDLVRALAEGADPDSERADAYMTFDVEFAHADLPLAGVADVMRAEAHADARAKLDAAADRAMALVGVEPELVVRDLDLEKIKQVRDRWAFYRDRRPDAYQDLFER